MTDCDSEIRIELSPAPGNPRNSEGAFLPLRDGRVLFCYSAFLGDSARDYTEANIACVESSDGGASWSRPHTLFTAESNGAMNLMSVSLLRMRNGEIGLFYLVRRDWDDMRVVLRRSQDEGEHWSEMVECTPRKGYFVMNNDRALRLSTGRILLPAAEHTLQDAAQRAYTPAIATFFYSDNDGMSWHESAARLSIADTGSASGLQEPGIVELWDGSLYGWARTDLCLQYEFASRDGGATWSPPRPSRFTSPLSPLSTKRMPDGRLFAVWNPIPAYVTRESSPITGGRTPLVASVSADDGTTWSAPWALETDPEGGYCYTAICFTEVGVLLAYCGGDARRDASCLNRLILRRIPYSAFGDAENGKTSGAMGIGF